MHLQPSLVIKNISRILIPILFIVSLQSFSQVGLPETSGIRGFVRPSIGYLNFSSNMVASFLRYDLAARQTKSVLARPESQAMPIFLFPFEVTYTFAKSRTQIILGTQLDDLIRFNLTQQLGVRQQFKNVGVFQLSFLLNGLPTKIWKDPYVANEDRVETPRNSRGVRFIWDLMFNTGLRVQYAVRRMKPGEELSGQWLKLVASDRELLVRNGWLHNIEVLYWIKLKGRQFVAPAVMLIIDAKEGEAMARNAAEIKINYTWIGKQFSFAANSYFGYSLHRGENPIYGKTQEDIYFSLMAMVYYENPWGWKIGNSDPMRFFLSTAIYRSDTNIDFYYKDAFLITGGVFFRWAKND